MSMFEIRWEEGKDGGSLYVRGIGKDGLVTRFGASEGEQRKAIEKIALAVADKFRVECACAMLQSIADRLGKK